MDGENPPLRRGGRDERRRGDGRKWFAEGPSRVGTECMPFRSSAANSANFSGDSVFLVRAVVTASFPRPRIRIGFLRKLVYSRVRKRKAREVPTSILVFRNNAGVLEKLHASMRESGNGVMEVYCCSKFFSSALFPWRTQWWKNIRFMLFP